VIAPGRTGRIEGLWQRLGRALSEELAKNKLNADQIVPMVGLGLYPAEADDPAELERVVRRRMEPLV